MTSKYQTYLADFFSLNFGYYLSIRDRVKTIHLTEGGADSFGRIYVTLNVEFEPIEGAEFTEDESNNIKWWDTELKIHCGNGYIADDTIRQKYRAKDDIANIKKLFSDFVDEVKYTRYDGQCVKALVMNESVKNSMIKLNKNI